MDYKQSAIAAEMRKRIADGAYTDRLPTTVELAREFGVNPKTMSKALARLVESGLLERRRKSGIRLRHDAAAVFSDRLVEVIFEGFSSIFVHPFWSDIWLGILAVLSDAGYRTVLTPLTADPATGMLDMEHFSFCGSAGKIVLGVSEPVFLRRIAASGVPCIAGCDPIDDPHIAQITFDFTDGIRDAVAFLHANGGPEIGFIGMVQSMTGMRVLNKYAGYLKAIQEYRQADPRLIEHARPLAGHGAAATRRLLERIRPDALLVACDSQFGEITEVLRENNLQIPVIGCDGLPLPQFPASRRVVEAPRRFCGELLARNLLAAIRSGGAPQSQVLKAHFR